MNLETSLLIWKKLFKWSFQAESDVSKSKIMFQINSYIFKLTILFQSYVSTSQKKFYDEILPADPIPLNSNRLQVKIRYNTV